MSTLAPIKIQLVLDGVQNINVTLQRLLEQMQATFRGTGRAAAVAGQQSAQAFDATQARMEQLRNRIERAQRAYEALRQSGQATAQALAEAEAKRDRIVGGSQASAQKLQPTQTASARDVLGLRPFADIQGDIDRARKAFDALKASGTLSATEIAQAKLKLKERIAELEAQTNGFAQSFLKVKESAAAAAGAFLAFRAASQEAIAFEAAMADVRKVVDATPEGFAQITQSIRGLASELPITAVGLAQMAEAGGQLGIAGDKIPEFVRLAAEMSVAFKISADEAGNAVGKLGNIFGLQVPQVRVLADSINALGDSTAATERDIVNVLQRSGGMARQFGLSAQQTGALATSILSLGDAPEVAATAINNLLSKLQAAPQQSKEFLSVLKVLGVDAKQLAVDIEQDAEGALLQFLGTLEKLDNKSRSQALTGLFGIGGDTASLAKLTGNLDQLRTALKTAQGEAAQGGLGRALAIQTETAKSQLEILRNAVGDIGIALGAALLPVIKAVASVVTALAKVVSAAVDTAPALFSLAAAGLAVRASLGALSVLGSTVGLMLAKLGLTAGASAAGVAAAGTAATGASVGVGALGVAMRFLLGPIGLVTLAISGLILLWDKLADAKKNQVPASSEDIARERQAIQTELNSIKEGAAKGRVGFNVQGRKDELDRRMAQLDAQQREQEAALRASAGARGGAGAGYDEDKTDLTAQLAAQTEAAKAAADKARALADAQSGLSLARAKAVADAELRLLDQRETALEAARAAGQVGEREAADKSLAIEQDRLTVKARLIAREIELEALRATTPGDAAAVKQQEAKLVALRAQLADVTAQIQQAPAKAAAAQNFQSDDPTFDPLGDADRKFSGAVDARSDARFEAARRANDQFQASRQQLSLALIRDDRQRAQAELDIEAQRLRDQLDLQVLSDADRRQREDELTAYLADKNAQLADQFKPGWQKLVEGWADTTKLMRDHTDTLMSTFVQAGEDAFVKFAQTGKLQFKGLVDTLIAEMARVQYRKLLGAAGEAGDGDLLGGLMKLGAMALTGNNGWSGANVDAPLTATAGQVYDFQIPQARPFSDGGPVSGPGTGTSDDILARLSDGEFVVRAAAVQKLGVGLLQRLNRADRVPAFAAGGLVGKMPALAASAAPGTSGQQPLIQNITLQGGVSAQDVQAALRQAKAEALAAFADGRRRGAFA